MRRLWEEGEEKDKAGLHIIIIELERTDALLLFDEEEGTREEEKFRRYLHIRGIKGEGEGGWAAEHYPAKNIGKEKRGGGG